MDLTKQKDIYNTIRTAEAKNIWPMCGLIASLVKQATLDVKNIQKKYDKLQLELNEALSKAQEKTPLPSGEVTDDQLRQKLRTLLLNKLNDETLSAAEIAQLKDIFGLTNAKQDITIEIVSYKALA